MTLRRAYVGAEMAPHAKQGLGMQLRYPRFRQPEHCPDLAHRQLVPVVERQEDLLAFGKLSDRLGDEAYALLVEEAPERVGMRVILDEIELAGAESEVVEADQRDRSDLHQHRAIRREREAEHGRELVLARGTPERELEGMRCPFD